jgi:hypothetical protein
MDDRLPFSSRGKSKVKNGNAIAEPFNMNFLYHSGLRLKFETEGAKAASAQ